jgi:dephospho-CoA kinase
MMLRVGLTGSIGVGKSFVASVLAKLGCHVLDADQTAREVVAPNSAGLHAVVEAFGADVVQDDEILDRKRLGALVFADEAKRQLLNSILHPYIIAAQDEQLRTWETKDPHGIGVIDAALMIESGGYERFDKVIVVYCDPDVQLQRVMVRNGFSPEEAGKRIAAQLSQEGKKKVADYLIDTSQGFEATRKRTEEVYRQLRANRQSN